MDIFSGFANTCAFKLFFITGYVYISVEKIARCVCSIYGVGYIARTTSVWYNSVYNYINSIVAENDGERWINISFISTKSLSPAIFAYKESYKYINLDTNNSILKYECLLKKPLNAINDELVSYGNIEYEDIMTEVEPRAGNGVLMTTDVGKLLFNPHKLFILKLKSKYVCKIYIDRTSGYYIDSNLTTNVKIQTLLYQHPSLNRGLVLKLSADYFLSGNEILSSVFVARLLQQQYGIKNVAFDSRYTLFGIDNNSNMFRLKSDQFLKIRRATFNILDVSSAKNNK